MSNTTNLGDAAQTKNILTDNLNTTTITDINGQTGLPGQVLSSTALGIDWVAGGGGGVAAVNAGTNISIPNPLVPVVAVANPLNATINFGAQSLTDSVGAVGAAGDILTSGSGGLTLWAPNSVTPNLQAVCTVGASYTGTISVDGVTDCQTIDSIPAGTTDINSFRTNVNGFLNINRSAYSLTAYVPSLFLTSDILVPQVIVVPDPDWNCIAIDLEEITTPSTTYICFIIDYSASIKNNIINDLVYSYTLASLDPYVANPVPVVPTGFFASQVSPTQAFFLFPFSGGNVALNSRWRFSFLSFSASAI